MYLLDGDTYIKARFVDFKPPRNRYHGMTEAYCDGGEILSNTKTISGYVWKCFLRGDEVCIQREDTDVVSVLFKHAGINKLDFCFDQNMRPFVCFSDAESSYYHHFSRNSLYESSKLPESVRNASCILDLPEDINLSDIHLAYSRDGNLCVRVQRDRFSKEYIAATSPNKSLVWRAGYLTGYGSHGYMWR